MPVDVAVQKEDSRVVGDEDDLGPAFGWNANDVAPEVIRVALCGFVVRGGDDPEIVTVDVNGMLTSIGCRNVANLKYIF